MKGERSELPPQFGGARLRKGRKFHQRESVDTIDLMGWVDRCAEPWPSARPRLGPSIGLTHYLNRYPSISPVEMGGLSGVSPHQVGSTARPFTFHIFLS